MASDETKRPEGNFKDMIRSVFSPQDPRKRRMSCHPRLISASVYPNQLPFIAAGFLERALQVAGLSVPSIPLPSMAAKGMGELLLAIALVAVVALGEETIFRGYLILRLKAITTSPTAALLSATIFSLGHGYEGSAGVVTVGVMGLVFALVYLWRQSLVAPIVMHFLQDFVGIVLLPLLKMK